LAQIRNAAVSGNPAAIDCKILPLLKLNQAVWRLRRRRERVGAAQSGRLSS